MIIILASLVVFIPSFFASIIFTMWTVKSNKIETVYRFPEHKEFSVDMLMLSGAILLIFGFLAQF